MLTCNQCRYWNNIPYWPNQQFRICKLASTDNKYIQASDDYPQDPVVITAANFACNQAKAITTTHPTGTLIDLLNDITGVQDVEQRFALNFDILADTKQPDYFVNYVMSCVTQDVIFFRSENI